MSSDQTITAQLGHEYWDKRWTEGQTQWRAMEQEHLPFERNTKALCDAFLGTTDHDLPAEGAKRFDPPALLRGAVVFVPLCGDTPALSFFAKLGASVIGIDLSVQALEKAAKDQFEGWAVERTTTNGFELLSVSNKGEAATVQLLAGDIFAFFEAAPLAEMRASIDVVYDRASLIAIEPALRERYVAGMNGILHGPGFGNPTRCLITGLEKGATSTMSGPAPRQRRVMFLSAIERIDEETRETAGPPFHTSEEDVFRSFVSIGSDAQKPGMAMVVPHDLDAPAEGADQSVSLRDTGAPFYDTYYSILVNAPQPTQ